MQRDRQTTYVLFRIIYISSKLAIEAYGIAESEYHADGPLNSRVESRLNIIDSLLCKTNDLLLVSHHYRGVPGLADTIGRALELS